MEIRESLFCDGTGFRCGIGDAGKISLDILAGGIAHGRVVQLMVYGVNELDVSDGIGSIAYKLGNSGIAGCAASNRPIDSRTRTVL